MATAAVRDAADYAVDLADGMASTTQYTARSVSNSVQNAVTSARENATPEDMEEIHVDDDDQQQESRQRHPVQHLLEDSHIVKEPTQWGVAVHDVSFSGIGGGMFLMMVISLVISMAAFASIGWSSETVALDEDKEAKLHVGLWEQCVCTPHSQLELESWFGAAQAMITIGFVVSWFCMLCITLYMCLCMNVIKKTFLLFGMIATSCISVLFYFIGLVIYGAEEMRTLGWSYGISYVSTCLCLLTGIFAFIQLRRSIHII